MLAGPPDMPLKRDSGHDTVSERSAEGLKRGLEDRAHGRLEDMQMQHTSAVIREVVASTITDIVGTVEVLVDRALATGGRTASTMEATAERFIRTNFDRLVAANGDARLTKQQQEWRKEVKSLHCLVEASEARCLSVAKGADMNRRDVTQAIRAELAEEAQCLRTRLDDELAALRGELLAELAAQVRASKQSLEDAQAKSCMQVELLSRGYAEERAAALTNVDILRAQVDAAVPALREEFERRLCAATEDVERRLALSVQQRRPQEAARVEGLSQDLRALQQTMSELQSPNSPWLRAREPPCDLRGLEQRVAAGERATAELAEAAGRAVQLAQHAGRPDGAQAELRKQVECCEASFRTTCEHLGQLRARVEGIGAELASRREAFALESPRAAASAGARLEGVERQVQELYRLQETLPELASDGPRQAGVSLARMNGVDRQLQDLFQRVDDIGARQAAERAELEGWVSPSSHAKHAEPDGLRASLQQEMRAVAQECKLEAQEMNAVLREHLAEMGLAWRDLELAMRELQGSAQHVPSVHDLSEASLTFSPEPARVEAQRPQLRAQRPPQPDAQCTGGTGHELSRGCPPQEAAKPQRHEDAPPFPYFGGSEDNPATQRSYWCRPTSAASTGVSNFVYEDEKLSRDLLVMDDNGDGPDELVAAPAARLAAAPPAVAAPVRERPRSAVVRLTRRPSNSHFGSRPAAGDAKAQPAGSGALAAYSARAAATHGRPYSAMAILCRPSDPPAKPTSKRPTRSPCPSPSPQIWAAPTPEIQCLGIARPVPAPGQGLRRPQSPLADNCSSLRFQALRDEVGRIRLAEGTGVPGPTSRPQSAR